jgi:hypothetical protein
MRESSDHHVDILSSLVVHNGSEVVPGRQLVPVNQPDLPCPDCNLFLLLEVDTIEVTTHHVEISAESLEPVGSFPTPYVSGTDNVLDLPRNEQLLEFVGDVDCSHWHVEVADH